MGADDVTQDRSGVDGHSSLGGASSEPDRLLTPRQIEIPTEIPVLPVKNMAAFPGTIMPLTVLREKSHRLLDSVLTGDKLVGIVAQRSERTEDPVLEDLYRIGTVCQVLKLLKLPDNTDTIILHGVCRFGIESLTQTQPYWKARVLTYWDSQERNVETEAIMHNVRHVATQVIELSPNVPEEALQILNAIDEPGSLADFLSANLSMGLVYKQELLETFSVRERLIKVNVALSSQLEVLQLSKKLQSQVRDQIDKTQREYYLQEQLKAIRKELGQDEGDPRARETKKLESKIAKAGMPKAVESEAKRELERLSNLHPASPEHSVALDYINWLCELPWSLSTVDQLDIQRAAKILDQDHYGLHAVKKRILEFLAVRKLKPDGKGPILCFTGPPGVGKTSLGQSIARSMGRKFIRMSLGGARDEADIRGHRRTYIGALPGRIIQELRKCGSNNPVFMLDEIDKIGSDFRGDPASALLEVLDPQQNHSFTDHYLGVPFDLSNVFFIATANYMDPIQPALRDRMEVLELSSYTQGEKLAIAKRYLLPRQIRENGLTPSRCRIDDAALRMIIESHTREAGVRNLERQIGAVCRGMAVQLAGRRKKSFSIHAADLGRYLGPPDFQPEVAMRVATPGVVTALAFTPTGGEILFVEASKMAGQGQLILTGQVGDVMRESAHAAFSLLRGAATHWGLGSYKFGSYDVHVHIPAGAIPKDGPSAGVAMFLAILSALTGRTVKPDLAVTGELTLRGLVLPVGGIKEKVLAAGRAGIRTVLLPSRNKKDLTQLTSDVKKQMSFKLMSRVEQAVRLAFSFPPGRTLQKPPSERRRRKTASQRTK